VASRDNVARMKIDLEREKELFRQLKAKDDRINALHGKIGELNAQLNRPSGG
jgi:HAMP domain-containing protein